MERLAKRESITPTRLLQLFEDKPFENGVLANQHIDAFFLKLLLPGEELILQQNNVTLVGTLSYIAKGTLYLTNYRLIFTGLGAQENGTDHLDHINQKESSKRGYRYQEKRYQIPKVYRGIKKIHTKIGNSMRIKGRAWQSTLKRRSQQILFNSYNLEDDEENADSDTPESSVDLLRMRLGTRLKPESANHEDDDCSQTVLMTIPILSICEVRKYPKQFLEKQKLRLLRDGVEVLCSNMISARFCIGESETVIRDSDTDDVEKLICFLESQRQIGNVGASFAYKYAKNIHLPRSCHGILEDRRAPNFYKFSDEITRLKLNGTHHLKVVAQTVCSSYPQDVIIPSCVANIRDLRQLADYHTENCFPVVTWKGKKSGCFLFRSGMPKAARGHSDSRCEIDEQFFHELCSLTANREAKVLVLAERNSLGSGSSTQSGLSVAEGAAYYYPHCLLIIDDDLSDIQAAQNSALKLMSALADKTDDSKYLSALEDSGWLRQIQKLLELASTIASAIENDGSSVVVAYGQGTDRTSQIVSLAQLLLDPYYRTLDGFQVLIQKEWLAFRHQFVARNLSSLSREENLSPIFLQFLDCVWQVAHQFPTLFQFNDHLLEELAVHSYSARFGTFLNLERSGNAQDEAISFWTVMNVISIARDDFTNSNYDENENTGILYPVTSTPWLKIWKWHYQYKAEERLTLAVDIANVQLEKLQREYQEKFEEYRGLLQALSELDANYATRYTFHTRSAGSLLYKEPDVCSLDSLSRNNSVDPDWKPKNILTTLFGKKSKSFNNLSAVKDESNTKTGNSTFYGAADNGGVDKSLGTFPRSGRLVSGQSNLRTALNDQGIKFLGVNEVQVTEKTCSGYLVKQGKVRKSWKRRWFVLDLRKGCVAYFDNHLSESPKGVFKCITITQVYKHHNQEKHPNLFIIDTMERRYSIEAPNYDAMDVWVGCFLAIVK